MSERSVPWWRRMVPIPPLRDNRSFLGRADQLNEVPVRVTDDHQLSFASQGNRGLSQGLGIRLLYDWQIKAHIHAAILEVPI